MIRLENAQFIAEINPVGAELTHLVHKADGREVIWNDPTGTTWPRHAPVLFPSIGRSNDDHYVVNGQSYAMKQHGFARDFTFDEVTLSGEYGVELTLHATPATRMMYPFDFALTLAYELTETGLAMAFTVANLGEETMPFALGYHPGFALRQPLEQYSVTLVGAKTPLERFGIGPVPFRNGEVMPLAAADGNVIPLSHALLDDGLIIVDAMNASAAVLIAKDGSECLTLDISDWPYLTLWSPEGKNAPFVCVEPFDGLPDEAGAPSDWFEKRGNYILAGGEMQTANLRLTVD